MSERKVINLVPLRWSRRSREYLIKQRLFLVNAVLGILGVVVLFVGGFYYLWRANQLKALTAQNLALEQNLVDLKTENSLYLQLRANLQHLLQVEAQNTDHTADLFRSLLVQTNLGETLSRFDLDRSQVVAIFDLPAVDNVSTLLNSLASAGFKSAVLDSVESKGGAYELKVRLTL